MNNAVASLQTSLSQETGLVQEFIAVLEHEATVLLEGGDDKALGASTETKNTYADQLATAADQRQGLLTQLGYSADKAGLDALAQAHPTLLPLCRKLYEAAERANELNVSNGIIIDTFLTHNQQTLDSLRVLAGSGDLYDASGRTRPGAKGQAKDIKAG